MIFLQKRSLLRHLASIVGGLCDCKWYWLHVPRRVGAKIVANCCLPQLHCLGADARLSLAPFEAPVLPFSLVDRQAIR